MNQLSNAALKDLVVSLENKGFSMDKLKELLWELKIETAGWNFVSTGSRFSIHPNPGAARNILEKIDDASESHRLTGICPELAINSVADLDGIDPLAIKQYTTEKGIKIGSVTPNLAKHPLFQNGSITHRDPAVRNTAMEFIHSAIDAAVVLGAGALSLWIHDGSYYPGQIDFRHRKRRAAEALKEISGKCPTNLECLVEYKLFEPAPYHTDIADWGMAYVFARNAGDNVRVLLDMGHHAQGTNIQHLAAFMIDEGILGGIHLNDRQSADDDLTLGSINPYTLFLVLAEVFHPESNHSNIRFSLDQHHTSKPPLLATVQSIAKAQEIYLKTLLIERDRLSRAWEQGDVVEAELVLQDAFATDVRPLLKAWRLERGLPADPVAELKSSEILTKLEHTRS